MTKEIGIKPTKVYKYLDKDGELITEGTIPTISEELNMSQSSLRSRTYYPVRGESLVPIGIQHQLYEYWDNGELQFVDTIDNIAERAFLVHPMGYFEEKFGKKVVCLHNQFVVEPFEEEEEEEFEEEVKIVKMVKAKKHEWNPKGRYVNYLHDKYFEKWDIVN